MIMKKENNHAYIIADEPQTADTFALQMILENEIPGFVSCKRQMFNARSYLYYDVSAKRPLSDGALLLCARQLEKLLEALLCALQTVSSYFLEAEGISLDPEMIFEEKGEWYFCYFADAAGSFEDGLVSLSEFLLAKVDQNDEKAVVLVYRFYQSVKRREGLPVNILQNILFDGQEEFPARAVEKDREEITGGRSFLEETKREAPAEPERENMRCSDGDCEEEKDRRPDPLSLSAFCVLVLGSTGYGILFAMREHVSSAGMFLQFRQGLLCVAFLLLGILGLVLCLLPQTLGKGEAGKIQDIETEVFEIPPIDKI